MDAKYYAPSVEEFHAGFEFERCDGGYESFKDVFPRAIDLNIFYEHPERYLDYFRVKYLDRADILAEGFKEWCKEDVYELWDKDKRYWQLHIGGYQNNEDGRMALELHEGNQGINGPRQDILVWVKNKSELRLLMKQLGIK